MADDPYVQARKALSVRGPFEEDDSAGTAVGQQGPPWSRDTSLPAAFYSVLFQNSDSRRRHKKAAPLPENVPSPVGKKHSGPGRPPNIWEITEDFFRPVSLEDIDLLASKNDSLTRLLVDTCLQIPQVVARDRDGSREDRNVDFRASFEVVVRDEQAPVVNVIQDIPVVGTPVAERSAGLDSSENVATPVLDKLATHEEAEDVPLNWVLGSRQRCVLTTERPNKKRKLLGEDAGLRRLLKLPRQQEDVGSLVCDACFTDAKLSKVLQCSSCKVLVHQDCYGLHEDVNTTWLCSWCKHLEKSRYNALDAAAASQMPCVLCPNNGGAMKYIGDGTKFAHLFCSIWTPEVYVEDTSVMEPILNVGGVPEMRARLLCFLCKVKHGVCVRCSHGTCRTSFHPLCARNSKLQMEIWGMLGCDNVELRAFCLKHSAFDGKDGIKGGSHVRATGDGSPRAVSTCGSGNNILRKLKLCCNTKDDNLKKEGMDAVLDNEENATSDQNPTKRTSGEIQSMVSKHGGGRDVQYDENDGGVSLQSPSLSIPNESNGILIASEAFPLSEEVVSDEEGKADEENEHLVILNENIKGDTVDEACHYNELPETILDVSRRYSKVAEPKENAGEGEHINLPLEPQLVRETERGVVNEEEHLTDGHATQNNSSTESCLFHHGVDFDWAGLGGPGVASNECFSTSYVHPYIKNKLIRCNRSMHRKGECSKSESTEGFTGQKTSSWEEAVTGHTDCTQEAEKIDKYTRIRGTMISELSPEDEIEGEMVYLQNKLIDNVQAIKCTCEDLIIRIVKSLPNELDGIKKRKWDQVLVTQFLRELREAKKRGRKERKHKEAQAVLAAAAAAAASSTRNSSLRKDTSEDILSAHQENTVNVNTTGRAKDGTSRSVLVKTPSDKLAGGFQIPDLSKGNTLICDICRRGETVLNRVFVCSSCKVAVHLDCYRKLKDPIGSWKCELCEDASVQSASLRNQATNRKETSPLAYCALCGGTSGAFRKSTDEQWVHAFCAEWLLEPTFKRGQHNVVEGLDAIFKEKGLLSCCICNQEVGVCLKCSYGNCHATFHPSCARSAGLYMNVKCIGGRLHHRAYCARHSSDQREADIKQYGAEDLKSMKQMRVELEKLHLLCERIIRREKLKRELVICSHEIHASRRDCVAFSALVRSSFFPPGGSSESATTSVDDKSYSGIQKSDDITIDSAVCSSRTKKFPVHMDVDRRTDDSSTSQLSIKRKLDDRTVYSGKQLPQRAMFVPFRNVSGASEKKTKHTETLQKELVMTSLQASIQNRRLPKGFVYVPVGCLSEEKPVTSNPEPREPKEPSG